MALIQTVSRPVIARGRHRWEGAFARLLSAVRVSNIVAAHQCGGCMHARRLRVTHRMRAKIQIQIKALPEANTCLLGGSRRLPELFLALRRRLTHT